MLATGVTACGVTKYLPENSYMLNRNKVKADKDAPREERISSTQLEKYIPQRETKKFLGTNLPAWLYLQGGPDSLAGKGNLLKSIGSEPAILDSTLTEIGARNLKLYMNSRGFYESWSDYSVKYNEKRKKATVTYRVKQGEPFRIRNISYDFRDSFVEQVIREDSTRTLLKKGNIFDTNILKDERQRIADKLHNSGYFNFSISNISFKADTTVGDHLADITMVVRQHLAGYDDGGNPILENNSIYSIRNIYVLPNYDPVRAAGDSGYARDMDTTEYRGLKILTEPGARNNIRPQTLRRAINLYPDYLYSYELVQRTYDDILQLSYYKNARILFDEAPADDTGLVTYVGGEEEAGEAIHTSEKQLNCTIYCTPALRQGYTLALIHI